MKRYWFLSRRLRYKAQSSFFKCNKLISHFFPDPQSVTETRDPHNEVVSFDSRFGASVSGLPKMMSWGLLLTPTPALVPAATSTRYCTPACSPPTTTERMVASTDLLTWKRVSLAKHQIWQRQTRQREFIVRLHSLLVKYSAWFSVSGAELWSYFVLLDDAVLLVGGRGVPWHADGRAVMAPYCQHCHLLRRCTRCWCVGGTETKEIHQIKDNMTWHNIFLKREVSTSCFLHNVQKGFASPTTLIDIHTASHKTKYFLSQWGRWPLEHFISVSFLNGWTFLHNWEELGPKKIHHSPIILSLRLYYRTGIINNTHQAFQIQIVLY